MCYKGPHNQSKAPANNSRSFFLAEWQGKVTCPPATSFRKVCALNGTNFLFLKINAIRHSFVESDRVVVGGIDIEKDTGKSLRKIPVSFVIAGKIR